MSILPSQAASVEGDYEVTLSGNGSSDDDFNTSTFGGSGSLGYSVTDSQEIGVRQDVSVVELEDEQTRWNGATRAFYNFQYDLGRPQPFIGANVGYEYGRVVDASFIGGPEAGLQFYVKPKTFIEAMLEYQIPFEDADEADLVYSLGIGFNF
jgi:hypothetical protein